MPRLFGLRRSPDKIGLSTTAAILSSTPTERSASRACAWQRALDHARDAPASLCKKFRLNACARHRARSNLTRIERIAASDSLVQGASSPRDDENEVQNPLTRCKRSPHVGWAKSSDVWFARGHGVTQSSLRRLRKLVSVDFAHAEKRPGARLRPPYAVGPSWRSVTDQASP